LVEKVARDCFSQSQKEIKENQSRLQITFDTLMKTALTDVGNTTKQRELEANACNKRQVPLEKVENACEHSSTGYEKVAKVLVVVAFHQY